MGIDCDRFLVAPAESLKCCICTDVFEQPVMLGCGHTFCKACVCGDRRQRNCPQCRAPISTQQPAQNFVLKDLIEDLVVWCENRQEGCGFNGAVRVQQDHASDCGFVRVFCSHVGCPLNDSDGPGLLRQGKQRHEADWREVECERMKAHQVQQHMARCLCRREQCLQGCGST